MRNVSLASLLVAVGSFGSPLYAQDWANRMFDERSHDFGSVARNAKAEHAFILNNIYMADVHIASVRSSCGCATPRIEKSILKTYEKGAVIAKLNTDRLQGPQRSTITVTVDKPAFAQVQLQISAFIHGDVILDPDAVEFGAVEQGLPAQKRITVTWTRGVQWKIVKVKNANPHVTAEAGEKRRQGNRVVYELVARLDENAPPGYLQDQFVLVTNDAQGKEIPVMVTGRVQAGLSVSPSSLFLGVVKPGDQVTKRLVLRAKQPFAVTGFRTDCECFKFDIPAAKKSLHLVPLTFTASETPGAVAKTLQIETDSADTRAEVKVFGVVAK